MPPFHLSAEVAPDPPGDLELMRRALELARRHGQPFAETWDAVLAHLAESPVARGADARDRAHSIGALEGTRVEWSRAFRHLPPLPIPQPRLPGGPPLTAREAKCLLKDNTPPRYGPGRPAKGEDRPPKAKRPRSPVAA